MSTENTPTPAASSFPADALHIASMDLDARGIARRPVGIVIGVGIAACQNMIGERQRVEEEQSQGKEEKEGND